MQRFVYYCGNLVLDSLPNAKPVEIFEKWGDMVIFPSIVDYFGGCVDENLKPIQMTRRKTG